MYTFFGHSFLFRSTPAAALLCLSRLVSDGTMLRCEGSTVETLHEVRNATPFPVVGGHYGVLGDGLYVYKPFRRNVKGHRELKFYLEHCSTEEQRRQPPCVFMPRFYGTASPLGSDTAASWADMKGYSNDTSANALSPPPLPLRAGDACTNTALLFTLSSSPSQASSGVTLVTPALPSTADSQDDLYLTLEDVTRGYVLPCVMDIKIGTQTWDDDASPEKVFKEKSKFPLQEKVGFRFTGMLIYQSGLEMGDYASGCSADAVAASSSGSSASPPSSYDKRKSTPTKALGKTFGYSLNEETLEKVFTEYLHDGARVRHELIPPLLSHLESILAWFRSQSSLRFYASSLLFVYEGADEATLIKANRPPPPTPTHPRVDVRMIDFSHVWPAPRCEGGNCAAPPAITGTHLEHSRTPVLDEWQSPPFTSQPGLDRSYITGLESLIGYLKRVQAGQMLKADTAAATGGVSSKLR